MLLAASLLYLYATTSPRTRKGFVEALRLIVTIGVIGSIVPIYPALLVGLYGYMLRRIRSNRPPNIRPEHALAFALFLFSFLSDFDAMTYFIPQAYHLVSGGGLRAKVGLYEPQNLGMSSVAAFMIFLDYRLGVDPKYYIFALRAFNAIAFIALLDFVSEYVDPERFLVVLMPLPIFVYYTAFKSSYADLAVALLVLATFRALYSEPERLPKIFATLALMKYIRPFALAAILALILPPRFYPAFAILPATALLRGDLYGFLYLSAASFGLLGLRQARRTNFFASRRMVPTYVRRIRETILFGRIFGEYGAYGIIAHFGYLRPGRFSVVSAELAQVRGLVEARALGRLTSAVFGPVVLGSLFAYAATHAPIGSHEADHVASAAILAGLVQIAVTYSSVTRQFLYLFVALSIVAARKAYRIVPAFSFFYASVYLEHAITVRPIYPAACLAMLYAFYFFSFLEGVRVNRRLLRVLLVLSLASPAAYYYSAFSAHIPEADRIKALEGLAEYISTNLPPGSLVILPGLVRGLATLLKDYTVLNVLDVASRRGIEESMRSLEAAAEFLSRFPAVALIVPSAPERSPYYALMAELGIALVALAAASAEKYEYFGLYSVLIARGIRTGPIVMAYALYSGPNAAYRLIFPGGLELVGPSIYNYTLYALIAGEDVEDPKFYYYLPLVEGGILVSVDAKLVRLGTIYVAYASLAPGYEPAGFSAIVDGEKRSLGEVPRAFLGFLGSPFRPRSTPSRFPARVPRRGRPRTRPPDRRRDRRA